MLITSFYPSRTNLFLAELPLQNNELWLERAQLPDAGLYFFRITSNQEVVAQGKVLAQ